MHRSRTRTTRRLARAVTVLVAFALPAALAGAAQAATCDGKTPTITGSGTIAGTSGSDVILGSAGADTISGGGGNDIICGGGGTDSIDGGPGADTVSYLEAAGAITASLASGTASGDGNDTLVAIENLTGSPFADHLTGNAAANVIDGAAGDDVMDGGPGNDTLSFASSAVGVTASLATGVASGLGNDSFTGFENLRGSAGNDTLTGSSAANTIDGGPGNDNLNGGAGVDTASFASSTASVTASLAAGTASGNGTDTLSGFENLLGSAKADKLTGDDSANRLDGSGGLDVCHVKDGQDVAANCETDDGDIEAAAVADTYTFAGNAGQQIFFDAFPGSAPVAPPSGTDNCNLVKVLTAPDQSAVSGFGGNSACSDDGVTLPQKGTYTLTISAGSSTTATGTYSFRILNVPAPQVFGYALGATVSKNAPQAGEGSIETPGAIDRYTISGTAGQQIFFDAFPGSSPVQPPDNCNLVKQLLDAGGNPVSGFGGNSVCSDDGVTLPATGTYTLQVWSGYVDSSATGSYMFRITNVPAPQAFTYSVGTTVSKDAPQAGEGNIDVPGAMDKYTFNGSAGQQIFFDAFPGGAPVQPPAGTDNCNLLKVLLDPQGHNVSSFGGNTVCGDDGVTLPVTGTYTLEVWSGYVDSAVTGTYSFKLWNVPAPQVFAYALGTTVSNGHPAAGAGNIETPGAIDQYTFSGTAGKTFAYTAVPGTGFNCNLVKVLLAPGGAQVSAFGGNTACGNGTVTLPTTGTYTLEVWSGYADSASTGTYSFKATVS